MQAHIDKLADLSAIEWNEIVRARIQTFVVETLRPFQILDDFEKKAYHLRLLTDEGQLIGYARLHYESDKGAILDQLLVLPEKRGQGFGKRLLAMALFTSQRVFPAQELSAITYTGMQGFLEAFGFSIYNSLTNGRLQLKQKKE